MGGRGSSFGAETIQTIGRAKDNSPAEPLIVAGMTPTDKGSRFTNAEKTLTYIEGKKTFYDKEQLQVIDDSGYVTRAFQGDEHSVGIDADTGKYMQGKIVTHNHPDVYGGTFSEADIGTLSSGMKELRASAREGAYSMKALENSKPVEFYKHYVNDSGKIQSQMKDISMQMAKKKWSSYESFRKANRKEQLKVLDSWYRTNAAKYGYEYTFTPNETYKLRSKTDGKDRFG